VYSGHLVPVPSDRYERYHGSAPRGTIRPLQRYHRSDILTYLLTTQINIPKGYTALSNYIKVDNKDDKVSFPKQ